MWSYLRPGGSPADRWTLAEPIGDRVHTIELAGESDELVLAADAGSAWLEQLH